LWALIPGGVLAGVGGLILAGEAGLKVLETFGNLSPILLVIVGAALLVGYYRKNRAK
jgi:hypothetical protein